MGSSNVNYTNQINSALQQANLPKSPLSQEYSNLFGNASPGLMNALTNIQSLGNSYINSNGAASIYQPQSANWNPPPAFGSLNQQNGQSQLAKTGANDWNGVFAQGNILPYQGGGGTTSIPGSGPSYSVVGQPPANNDVIPNSVPQASSSQLPSGFGTNPDGSYSMWNAAIQGVAPYNNGWTYLLQNPNNSFSQLSPQQLAQLQVNPSNPASGTIPGLNGQIVGYSPQVVQYLGSSSQLAAQSTFQQLQQIIQSGQQLTPAQEAQWNDALNTMGQGWSSITAQPAFGQQPYGMTTLPNGGQVATAPFNNPSEFLQNGQITWGSPQGLGNPPNTGYAGSVPGNQNGPYGPNNPAPGGGGSNLTGPFGTSGGGGPSGVSVGANGLPNGVNIPGVTQANPDVSSLFNAIAQNIGLLGSNALNSYQTVNPNLINPNSIPQATSNFSPTQANLSGVPNSTTLSPQTSQGFNAIQSILNQQLQKEIGDTRESGIGTGTSNSSGEGYAEAQLNAAALPQLSNALSQLYQTSVGNQLNQASLQQSGLLSNAGLANQYGLGGAQLSSANTLGNASNILQGFGQNANAQIGAGGVNNTAISNFNNLLATLSGQNISGSSSLENILSQLSQFNAGANNSYNLSTGLTNQATAQSNINNQLQQLMTLFGGGLGLASQGIPGGSANVNIGNTLPQGGGVGGALSGIGGLLQGLSAIGV